MKSAVAIMSARNPTAQPMMVFLVRLKSLSILATVSSNELRMLLLLGVLEPVEDSHWRMQTQPEIPKQLSLSVITVRHA